MIILTTPKISRFRNSGITSTVTYAGQEYCLAKVGDQFNMSESKMRQLGIDFWWQLGPGYCDCEKWEPCSYKGGIIEAIELFFSLSKEKNIAMCIYELSEYLGMDPFVLWEDVIDKE